MKEKLWVKMTAVILSYVMIVTLALSTAATVVMGYYKFYFNTEENVREEVLTDMAEKESYYVSSILIEREKNLTEYYKDKNVRFVITDYDTNKVIDTNYNNEPYAAYAESVHYEYKEWVEIDEYGDEYLNSKAEPKKKVEIYITKDMKKSDIFSVASKIIETGYRLKFGMIFIALISLAVSIILVCYLFCAAGHTPGGEVRCNALDKIPFDILTAGVSIAAILGFCIMENLGYSSDGIATVMGAFIVCSVCYFMLLGFMLSFATRIKTGTLFKNTIIFIVLKLIYKYAKKIWHFTKSIFSSIPFVYKWILFLAGIVLFCFFSVITILFVFEYISEFFGVLMIFAEIAAFLAAAIYIIAILGRIKFGGEKISSGDLNYKIDTKYMLGDFKDFAESLNSINNGLQSAINEKMKSERFKTELITNVSHDIKTPLTSIINYVDLIKREEIDNETVNNYVNVLDRQSSRLKKLVENLVEASKASTGNLPVNLTECNIAILLSQAIAEFEEKLTKAEITPVLDIDDNGIKVLADGGHLWRIFDNLLNNVCKYALPGTRVYIDVKAENDRAVVSFRNISKYQLNISADELMERFVRGDHSRNTEGSGLGLSIAKSLAELQGGKLELTVDGDLFKAVVIFNVIK